MQNYVKPFLKWAGGKTQVIPQLSLEFPERLEKFDTFIEPFVGGGAVLFHILNCYPNIKNIVINDINPQLIATYIAVKEKRHELISYLGELQKEYWRLSLEEQKQFFINKRERFKSNSACLVEQSSLFIFLNKTCFNGLYRVNKKGEFNVSFGNHRKPLICNNRLINKASELLQKVNIQTGDYANIVAFIQGRSFVYLDPPYRPVSHTSNFTTYNSTGFDDTKQIRLSYFCKMIDFESKWMMSNSSIVGDNFFREHYENFTIRQINAKRSIGASAQSRGIIRELLITNY